MLRIRLALVIAVAALVAVGTASGHGSNKKLIAVDADPAVITVGGKRTITVKAGKYDILVRDRSSDHNFHLIGAGVNKKTSVDAVTTVTWHNVVLRKGRTYRFVCDPHADFMKGTIRVR